MYLNVRHKWYVPNWFTVSSRIFKYKCKSNCWIFHTHSFILFVSFTDGKVPRCDSRIHNSTRMWQMATTNLWIREKEGQEILSRNTGIIDKNHLDNKNEKIRCNILSIHINFSARRFPNNFVVQEHVLSLPDQKNAERKWKLLFKKSLKKDVLFVLNPFASLKQNLFQCKC